MRVKKNKRNNKFLVNILNVYALIYGLNEGAIRNMSGTRRT